MEGGLRDARRQSRREPSGKLKVKLIRGEGFSTRETMRQSVFESIEIDYPTEPADTAPSATLARKRWRPNWSRCRMSAVAG
jgi:hypothetical protein